MPLAPFGAWLPYPIRSLAANEMSLQLPRAPGEDPTESVRRAQAEADAARRLQAEFARQLQQIRDAGPAEAQLRAAIESLGDDATMREVLEYVLTQGTNLGVTIALDQFAGAGITFDYRLVNEEAARWARTYSYELVRGINDTTRENLRTAVEAWTRSGQPFPDLVRELTPLFGATRAKLIATTETTRAYAEGSVRTYQASGVVIAIEWLTARDLKVCPICQPLEGVRATMSGGFPSDRGPILRPPAHPGCRCAVAPIVPTPEELEAGIARGIYDIRLGRDSEIAVTPERTTPP